MYIIVIAFILGILACALIIYVSNLKETIRRQQAHILDVEAQLKNVLSERSEHDSVH